MGGLVDDDADRSPRCLRARPTPRGREPATLRYLYLGVPLGARVLTAVGQREFWGKVNLLK